MVMPSLLDGARSMPEKKRKWMSGAVPEDRKGVFTAKAKAAGESVHEFAEAKKHAPGKLGKEARLAETFEHEAGHHRKEAIRDEAEHRKPRKSAEGLKKSFYGSKAKEEKA
jgi:hypothetical protein